LNINLRIDCKRRSPHLCLSPNTLANIRSFLVHELTGRVVVYGKILPEVLNYGHGRIIYDFVQSYEKALKQCCSSFFSAA